MARRRIPEINAGSMADIAFLLLIFFLVTASMDRDLGITQKLPVYQENYDQVQPVKERNILDIQIDDENVLRIEQEIIPVEKIQSHIIRFIENSENSEYYSESVLISEKLTRENDVANRTEASKYKMVLNELGDFPISKGIVALQTSDKTTFQTYLNVQAIIQSAFTQLRNRKAMNSYKKPFHELNAHQQEIIAILVPLNIAEPDSFIQSNSNVKIQSSK